MSTVAHASRAEEPPSGIQGEGTINEPFDQGNAPGKASDRLKYGCVWADQAEIAENVSKSEEPPSGIQGRGTAEEPYDQGNAPGKSP